MHHQNETMIPQKKYFPLPRFYTLNYTTDKQKQHEINYYFQLWIDQLLQSTTMYMHVPHQFMNKYNHLLFQVDQHNVFVSLHVDLDYEQETIPFCIMKDDVKEAILDWLENLCKPPTQLDSTRRKTL